MTTPPSPGPPCWILGAAGSVAVAKPAGLTSHDVVARARRRLGERRIGHAGTLDPDATGVLVLGIGPATRLLRFTSSWRKSYRAEVVLGVETTTLDASGEVTATHDMAGVTLAEAVAAAAALTGVIDQVPPMVSAVQVGGRRLYDLARQGIEVERAPRRVEVYRFEVAPGGAPGRLRIEVDCSSGTYVRTLAADLGSALGGGAHLTALHRSAVGPFRDLDCVGLDELEAASVGPAARLVVSLESLAAGTELAAALRLGKVLDRSALGAGGDGPWAVLDPAGELVAVCEPAGEAKVKPSVVLPPGRFLPGGTDRGRASE